MSDFTLDWLTVNRRLYNGEYPGTTFYWKPGDTIFLTLVNVRIEINRVCAYIARIKTDIFYDQPAVCCGVEKDVFCSDLE